MAKKTFNSTDKGMRKLISDLVDLNNADKTRAFDEGSDDLSIMLDESLRGVDIRRVYPEFYEKLRKDNELQQRFINGINTLRSDTEIINKQADPFLTYFEELNQSAKTLCVNLQLSIQQLQSVFFPRQDLVYRGASDQQPHYLLINEEIELLPVTYSLLVEGKLSDEPNKLTLEVDLAISDAIEPDFTALPVDIEVAWGNYSQHLTLNNEGVVDLTDVPFSAFLNADLTQVTAAMEISLSRPL
jgi:hypothetical protein